MPPVPGTGVSGHFLLRRWWRVLRRSLRCFFFAIRLRRFLMTEPMNCPRRWCVRCGCPPYRPRSTHPNAKGGPRCGPPFGVVARRSGGVDERAAQVGVHLVLRHAEGPADADGRELPGMDHAVDGHLRDSHDRGDLRDGEEPHLRELALRGHRDLDLLLFHSAGKFRHGACGRASATIGAVVTTGEGIDGHSCRCPVDTPTPCRPELQLAGTWTV